eukprot:TRINITY_DN9184_c0_g1_i2.p1 TRINITY_DN9184_c0_g1~~TRINITY_DN9184_c0_g1_i2.p1  ORF type:complete len:495 (+),score=82.25 TRINITY_DN9184_c0_g1_i2:202-1686(+)
MTSLVRSGGFGHLLYTTGGKSAAMKDIPKLLSLGWEVDTLEVSDPMPGTDHIEVRIHFSRSTLGTANISAHAALLSELAIAAGGSGRPASEWLCGSCDNLVFRRHISCCPRCKGLRDPEAEARLRAKAELATVLKSCQRIDASFHQRWLDHCNSTGESRDPMRHATKSLQAFLAEAHSAGSFTCLQNYQAMLASQGLAETPAESEAHLGRLGGLIRPPCSDKSKHRQLLIISAERFDWAIQLAREELALLRQQAKAASDENGTPLGRWLWASFDKSQRPLAAPPASEEQENALGELKALDSEDRSWEWVDVRKSEAHLGGECEVCVLLCLPQLHVDALGILSGLVVGGGLLVLVVADANDYSATSKRNHRGSGGAAGKSNKTNNRVFHASPFDSRFDTLLCKCPHVLLRHAGGVAEFRGLLASSAEGLEIGQKPADGRGGAEEDEGSWHGSNSKSDETAVGNSKARCANSNTGTIENNNGDNNNSNNNSVPANC